jgi:hypothetical protein
MNRVAKVLICLDCVYYHDIWSKFTKNNLACLGSTYVRTLLRNLGFYLYQALITFVIKMNKFTNIFLFNVKI